MTTSSTGIVTTVGVLGVPGARLHYEVRGAGPLLVVIGAPMDARAFAPLAELLASDHLVLTSDPRDVNRSPVDDPGQDSTPELRADDLSRLIAHLDAGPAVVLGSSGGAVSALALVQAHPEQVHTVIAHEPPLQELLDDVERLRVGAEDIIATYVSSGPGPAWGKFLAHANIVMPAGDDTFQPPAPVERDPQEVADERHFFLREFTPTIRWRPDIDLLRSVPTRVLVGLGEYSTDQLCDHTSRALASALGIEPTVFPGGHTGFVEDPKAFATRLRAVLASPATG